MSLRIAVLHEERAVAVLALPMPIQHMNVLVKGLELVYGKGLMLKPIDGYLVVLTPEPAEPEGGE